MNVKEVSSAIACLRDNGLPINLTDELKKRLDEECLFDGDDHLFKKCIESSKIYGEYGSGKSTIWVGKNFPKSLRYSVDTSLQWVTRVNAQLGSDTVKHIDVGDVGDWGRPKSYDLRQNFIRYAESLWVDGSGYDLILIDGRFRVLCFLTSLLKCADGTTILFDDYRNRQHYHVVEEFLKPVDFCGRQALFKVENKSNLDLRSLELERQRFSYVMD